MEMDGVHDDLDELKAEMEKLKEECRTKKELLESLRKAHNEQLTKFVEAKSLIEEQVQQLNVKSEEITEVRKTCEDLKSSLHEKELSLRHLNLVNEKLRVECADRIQKLEGENKALVLALDEATTRTQGWERKICAGNEEIEALKRLLLIAQKKCLEAEEKVKTSKELKQRDDVILKIEEENWKVQDQLKWKSEQFTHLEEAHKKLQDQFQLSKVEWEREKFELLDEICSLQRSLDSQTRISESLQSQLKRCNQALSHEESRRKILDVEVFELRSHFENIILECQEAKSNIENLTLQRDEDVAELRNALGTKETLSKEMEYKISHLEQDNQELQRSLKEFQEAQIKIAGGNSLKKLQNKLRGLELLHGQCSVNLKEKEAEWSSELEKMRGDVAGYISDLNDRDRDIQELQMKLEGCHSLLDAQNEEISLVIMVLKSEFFGAYTNLFNEKAEMEMITKETEQNILLLREQLETKNSALPEVDRGEGRFLMNRVESVEPIKHLESVMEEELEGHKKMFDELSNFQVSLKEQAAQMENAIEKSSKDFSYALERANCELEKKIHEVNQTKFELQEWKSNVEKVTLYLEENQKVLEQEKESLLAIAKDQGEKMCHLQQQIVLLESKIASKLETLDTLQQKKENYRQIAENQHCSIEKLQDEIALLKQDSAKRELELEGAIRVQKTFEQEEEKLRKIIKEKDQSIEDLSAQVSQKQDFESVVASSFSVIAEKQIEIDVLSEALEKAENLRKSGIHEKNKVIEELEREINGLSQKLKFQEESLPHSKKQVANLEAVLEAQKSETERMKDQFWSKQGQLEGLIEELQSEKQFLLEDKLKLSAEREDMLVQLEGVSNWISDFTCIDAELMDHLEKILKISKNENRHAMDLGSHGNTDSPIKGRPPRLFSLMKNVEEGIDNRSPLKAINH